MDTYLSILKRYWGYDDFRGIQRDIIESIGSGHDTLGLMPTGGGKSITFQVPALAKSGTCLVITPLIALMKDQVEALNSRGIKAACIHSGLSHEQTLVILENGVFNAYKFLYISPERLSSELFLKKLGHMNISFITVDEAHCICQWGYDFRPSYLNIAEVRKIKPNCPILALTATATPEVAKDIQTNLRFKEENVFRMSFYRPNLAYKVLHADATILGVLQLLNAIEGSCIIYTRNRQKCGDLAKQLMEYGFTTTYYHAGLKPGEKDERQNSWLRGNYRIMVATNAFGMGIDKPDVRLVIHVDLPDSIEEYFQEAGRAGRDGKLAWSVIVMDGKELEMSKRRVKQHFPELDFVRKVYEDVCCFLLLAVGDGMNVTREFNMERFCVTFHYHPLMLTSALDILDKAGYIAYRDAEEGTSRMRIDATRHQLFEVLDNQGEQIILAMLRRYGGIFVDFVFIDEDMISRDTGLSMDIIYQDLKELDRRGLISYIPRKHVPMITFLQRRVLKEELEFPYGIYAMRKEAYEFRLSALQAYCLNTEECRSRLLLRYFGETDTHRCSICDVCELEDTTGITEQEYLQIREQIIGQLQHGPVKVSELDIKGIRPHSLTWALDYMRSKEELMTDGVFVRLASSDN
ncbi:MAG: RecQ family ATP-dependent DNA helicase [Bacteroidaceae bacterium]|nr:RecQ family ATP-dependent DNA helicase [Bacteroidaceae bacterium]